MSYLKNAMLKTSIVIGFVTATLLPTHAEIIKNTDNSGIGAATYYAESYGVSVEEAYKRLGWESEIGDLESLLMIADSDEFAGLYIENTPVYKIYVLYKHHKHNKKKNKKSINGSLNPLIAKSKWRSFVKVRKVEHSYVELEQILSEVSAITRTLQESSGISASTNIDVINNEIEVIVTNIPEFENALLDNNIELPKNVRISYLPKLASSATYASGGMRLATNLNCTSGFTVQTAAGENAILTAGHCTGALRRLYVPGNTSSTVLSEIPNTIILNGSVDARLFSVGDLVTFHDVQINNGNWMDITNTVPWSSQPLGATVCKFGITTGYGCGSIINKTVAPAALVNNPINTFVQVRNAQNIDISSGGDSGGPIYKQGTGTGSAYGIMHAEVARTNAIHLGAIDAIYAPIDFVEAALNVKVLTGF